jgi:hypothetical protein
MRPVIIVFAKAPRAGRVKTRMVPALTPDEAAELHTAFVGDTLNNLLDFPHADTELHTDTETDAWSEFAVARRFQHEGDLGLRMFHALSEALGEGRPKAMILGSDVPDLPSGHLATLLHLDVDVALGPSGDGGYWGIAATRVDGRMFEGVEWSSTRELGQTIAACRASRLSVECGPLWYDLDTAAGLPRLIHSRRAPRSAAALAGMRISLE